MYALSQNLPFVAPAAVSPLDPLVRKLEQWKKLDSEDRAAIQALPHAIKRLKVHDYIVREGDDTSHCCIMLSGISVRHKILGDGQRQIVAIQLVGDVVDLQNSLLGKADHSVQMLTPGHIAMIPREEIKRLAFQHPTIGEAMWIDTLVDASISREWVANIGRRNARARAAHFLCELAVRLEKAGLGQRECYELPMTQEQLADALGLTSVHLNRTLKSIQADGLIDRSRPRSIRIPNWAKLAQIGDFGCGYLHFYQHESRAA